MALIKCSDCGRMLSDKARVCPHCGAPVLSSTQQSFSEGESTRVQAGGMQSAGGYNKPVGNGGKKPNSNVILIALLSIIFLLILLNADIMFLLLFPIIGFSPVANCSIVFLSVLRLLKASLCALFTPTSFILILYPFHISWILIVHIFFFVKSKVYAFSIFTLVYFFINKKA